MTEVMIKNGGGDFDEWLEGGGEEGGCILFDKVVTIQINFCLVSSILLLRINDYYN